MQNRVGVIDLGSNTFHLLIVDINDNEFTTIYKERNFVGLSENGITELSGRAMDRGEKALAIFKERLDYYNTSTYKIIGTSALRTANNGKVFLDRIKKNLGFDIEIIDGHREAELIYKGVNLLLTDSPESKVIMDVGGGSVEFIIIKDGQLVWSESFDIGVGVLYNLYELDDPVSNSNLRDLKTFIDSKLQKLRVVLKEHEISALIGASGSFEVVQSMNDKEVSTTLMTKVSLSEYHKTADQIIGATTAEREKMDGLPKSRVKLIVVAMILINRAVELIKPEKLIISPYALKEGVISEIKIGL